MQEKSIMPTLQNDTLGSVSVSSSSSSSSVNTGSSITPLVSTQTCLSKSTITQHMIDFPSFMRLILIYPAYKQSFIYEMLKDKTVRERVINTAWHLTHLAKNFPEYKAELIQLFLEDKEVFKQLIIDISDLTELANTYPEHQQLFIKLVLEDAKVRKRVVKTAPDLESFAKNFPEYKAVLIQLFLEDKEVFKQLIGDRNDLILLIKTYPEHKRLFIKLILEDPVVFQRVIILVIDLATIIYKHVSGCKKDLIQPFLNDRAALKKLIRNSNDLTLLAKIYPEHKQLFIELVLKDRTVFKRVVRYGSSDLQDIAQYFPDCKVIQKRSYSEVIAALESKAQIGQVAALMYQDKYGQHKAGFFAGLPDSINTKIAAFVGYHYTHSTQQCLEIAKVNYCVPR